MEQENVENSEKAPVEKKRTRSAQDTRIANEIAEARTLLNRIKSNPTLSAKCAARGISATRIDEALKLVDTAQETFNSRQQLMGEQSTEVATHKADYQAAYEGFYELRQCSRIVYASDPGMREALGATGRIPSDGEQFQTIVRAALSAAAKSPQKEDLAHLGFTSDKHATLSARVDSLEIRRQSVGSIRERAKQTTDERDAAITELRAFIKPLKLILKLIERAG